MTKLRSRQEVGFNCPWCIRLLRHFSVPDKCLIRRQWVLHSFGSVHHKIPYFLKACLGFEELLTIRSQGETVQSCCKIKILKHDICAQQDLRVKSLQIKWGLIFFLMSQVFNKNLFWLKFFSCHLFLYSVVKRHFYRTFGGIKLLGMSNSVLEGHDRVSTNTLLANTWRLKWRCSHLQKIPLDSTFRAI